MSFRPFFGDCLEKMKLLPDKSVDLFLCDLPYGCLKSNRKKYPNLMRSDNLTKPCPSVSNWVMGCEWDVKIDLHAFWEQVERLAKDDHTPVIHFCNARFGFELYNSKPDWFRYDLVWNKTNAVGFLSANKKPMASHENIYVFSKKGAYYKRKDIEGDFPNSISPNHKPSSKQNVYPSIANIVSDNTGRRCVKSVITVANTKGKDKHPTQKPTELYEWLIERYCPEGGTVLDPTAGSFTSVATACQMGRHGIGMEMNYDFFMKVFNQYKYLLIK